MVVELREPGLERRATMHAALGDPIRLAIVDEVTLSDRSPADLAAGLGISSSLLAHHVDLLIEAGIVTRTTSSGDRRRRYVQLLPEALEQLIPHRMLMARRLVFVCTGNSARSQYAQALWREQRPDIPATSGGTQPAERVNPLAVRAAERFGLDLGGAAPQAIPKLRADDLLVTVCDRAREGLAGLQHRESLHWAVPGPVHDADFDVALARVRLRVDRLVEHVANGSPGGEEPGKHSTPINQQSKGER